MTPNSKTTAVLTVLSVFFFERIASLIISISTFDAVYRTLTLSLVHVILYLLPLKNSAGVNIRAPLNFLRSFTSVVFFICLGICLAFVFPPLETGDKSIGLVRGVLQCAIVPISEELFFRGTLFARLKSAGFEKSALFVGALLFALCHAGLSAFCVSFVLGIVLVLYYERTNSLLLPILCHMANNLLSFLTLGRQVSLPLFTVSFSVCLALVFLTLCRKRLIYV